MSLDLYRQQLAAELEVVKALFTEYPVIVEYDNRIIVDPQNQVNPFLCAEFVVTDGRQADLSNKPIHRLVGMWILTAKDKKANGSAKALQLLEHFYPKLHRRKLGDVHLEMAKIVRARAVGGWWGVSAMLPFKIDKID